MISARIPVEVLAKLDEWAANNCTRSTALAELLAKALVDKLLAMGEALRDAEAFA
jgi:hypothetical protein